MLLVTKLRVITGQLDRRDVVTLRLEKTPVKLPANKAPGTAPIVGTPQVDGRLRVSHENVPFGPGVHGLLVVAHTSAYFRLQTEEIEIFGIGFESKLYLRQCLIELARVFVKRREKVGPCEWVNFHRLLSQIDG